MPPNRDRESPATVLAVCAPGHVASAIREAVESLGAAVKAARHDDPDLFMHALGCRSVVYAPEPRLLDGHEAPDADRMRAVLRGAHAPGVERIVVVFPKDADAWQEEARVLKKDGIGYAIVHARPLIDELADATNLHTTSSVWLPRGQTVDLVGRRDLVSTIRNGLSRDEWCGSTIDVPSERIEIGEAMRRAADIAGARVKVRVASPGVSSAIRKLSLWMGLEPPELGALCERLSA
jgi:hypothetical protein